MLNGVAFSPDGRLILTTSDRGDMTDARLWDARTGVPASPVMSLSRSFADSGDLQARRQRLRGSVRRPHDPSLGRRHRPGRSGVVGTLRNECFAMAFRPDGRSLVAVELPGIVHTWPMPEPCRRARSRTWSGTFSCGPTASSTPARNPLPSRPRSGDSSAPRPATRRSMPEATDEASWHEANARDAEAAGDGFALRWHLDRLIAARPDDGLLHARRARTCAVGRRCRLGRGRPRAGHRPGSARSHPRLDASPRRGFPLRRAARRRPPPARPHHRRPTGRLADLCRCVPRYSPGLGRSCRLARPTLERAIERGADICVPDPDRRRAQPHRSVGGGGRALRPGHRPGDCAV